MTKTVSFFLDAGVNIDRSTVSYTVDNTDNTLMLMSVFSALGTIAFSFGDTVLPEVQVGHLEE